jgi:hypothetical protein
MQTRSSSNGICAPTNTIIRDYAERLMSVERGRQLGIARSIAHLYADVLKEPIPSEIARLVGTSIRLRTRANNRRRPVAWRSCSREEPDDTSGAERSPASVRDNCDHRLLSWSIRLLH